MQLISCHIENFGKLHDYSVDFSEGANIICEENGWGKSTFAAFVRAMFYGLEGERKRSIEENEVTRYTPWQGGVFGGSLTFEVNGKVYIVTRTFGKTNEFELRDATTNLVSNDFSDRLGEQIFKVNRESFMRTVFIGQADCETSSTDAINAKIGALTDNSDDLCNFENANKKLTEIINSLNPKRVTGSISKRKGEITELERKVAVGSGISAAIDSLQKTLLSERDRYQQLKDQEEELRKEQNRVAKLQATLAKKEQWELLKSIKSTRSVQKKSPALSIAGVILAALGVVLALLESVPFGIIATVAGVIIVIADILKNRSAYEEAKRLYDEAVKQLEAFEQETDITVFAMDALEDEQVSLDDLSQKLSELADAREACYQLIEGYNDDLENLRQQYDEWEDNKIRLDETRRVQDEEQRKYNFVMKTQQYLCEAKESLTARYTTPIFQSFLKYYGTITGNTSEQLRIDANTNITVVEQGKQRETNTLSSGYRDLIGICLRVALVDAMYTDEAPVLIMDDPFVNLDDQKMAAAKGFLKQIAEKYQVIYFTCSTSRI